MANVNDLFRGTVRIANVGLFDFYQALKDQEVAAIHVDWRPPAGGDSKMQDVLARLRKGK